MQIDLRVLELLSSKICHDLISPVSAINNGVELIEDIGGSVVDEAMKLIANSAVQSSRRLRVFRIAYGRAGSEENLPLRDVRGVMEQYFEGGKIKYIWPEGLILDDLADQRGALKTLINMFIIGEDVLAYGGSVTLLAPPVSGQGALCLLRVEGRGAHMSEAYDEALRGVVAVENLTPRTIQPYITGQFARHFKLSITHNVPQEDRLEIILKKGEGEYDERSAV